MLSLRMMMAYLAPRSIPFCILGTKPENLAKTRAQSRATFVLCAVHVHVAVHTVSSGLYCRLHPSRPVQW